MTEEVNNTSFDESETKIDLDESTEKEMNKTNVQSNGEVVNLDSKLSSRTKFYVTEKLISDAKEKAQKQLEEFPELIENRKIVKEYYSEEWDKDAESLSPTELEDEVAKLQSRINQMKKQNTQLEKEVEELDKIKSKETQTNEALKEKIIKKADDKAEETKINLEEEKQDSENEEI